MHRRHAFVRLRGRRAVLVRRGPGGERPERQDDGHGEGEDPPVRRTGAQEHRSAMYTGRPRNDHSDTRRSRRAFAMTDTELNVMAAAAMIGLSSKPKKG